MSCKDLVHYFDVINGKRLALVCRCKKYRRKLMQ